MELEGGEVAAAAGGAEEEVEKNVDKLHLATVNLPDSPVMLDTCCMQETLLL